jgi:UPF0755 protein
VKLFLLAVFAAALGIFGWMAWFALSPIELRVSPLDFAIDPGSTLRGAARQVVSAGVPMPGWQFTLLARATGSGAGIKAGSYQVFSGVTPLQILRKLRRGEFAQSDIVFVEGWTFRDMREVMKAHRYLKHDSESLDDSEIMTRLGHPGLSPEGMFFPDTYVFARGASDLAVLARADQAMQKQLQSAWVKRTVGLPIADSYEALVLASIVEKETGSASDRTLIAAVFINRLRAGMRLQTDPTVIYGMGERFSGNLRKQDLLADTPFNTYTRRGLPPHPIAMPGLASINAVMHPAETGALYFVSRGDGTSQFSRTLLEHNRAVAKYQMPGARKAKSR